MNTGNNVLIFSVDQTGLDSVNVEARERARQMLSERRLSFGEGQGRYKGTDETSFVVVLPSNVYDPAYDKIVGIVNELASEYNQESVLYVDTQGYAGLAFLQGGSKLLGKMVEASKAEAESLDAYTKLGSTYYVIRG